MKQLHRIFHLFLSILLLMTPVLSWAEKSPSSSSSLTATIKKAARSVNPNLDYGMMVMTPSGQVLFSHHADQNFVPASNLKIYTSIAALLYFGTHYHYQTKLYTDAAEIKNGVLYGNLIVKFAGDPSFDQKGLADLLSNLKKYGVRSIAGNIYLDTTIFATKKYGPGWMIEDIEKGYGAPVAPVILDHNEITVTVNPDPKPGQPAHIGINPYSPVFNIVNQTTTGGGKKYCGLSFKMAENNQLTVTGCVNATDMAQSRSVAIAYPLDYAKGLIKHILAVNNIQFQNTIEATPTPANAKQLAVYESPSMFDLINTTMKESDNLYAESIFLSLGAEVNHEPGTWKNASTAVKSILQKHIHVNLVNSVLTDGSGLSRFSLVTPQQTATLLNYMWHDFPLAYEFVSALPIAGEDGTLRKRLGGKLHAYVRAKTGTMKGVSSLSGYLFNKKHQMIIFSILMQNVRGQGYACRILQDRMLNILYNETYMPKANVMTHDVFNNQTQSSAIYYEHRRLTGRINHLEYQLRHAALNDNLIILRNNNQLSIRMPVTSVFGNQAQIIKPHVKATLTTMAALIKHAPFQSIMVAAYPNEQGIVPFNQTSDLANVLARYLVSQDLPNSKILAIDSERSATDIMQIATGKDAVVDIVLNF